ncbi:MAG TPA: hypothetical protein VNN25_26080 [Thermoanaerobaculia bacterium]|nr:hypothetical protein [Thermoanaerobaculia bacterium]
MATAENRSGSQRNANHSRRAGLRSCGSDRDRRKSWTRPFRRTRRAIESSLDLISACRRVIEATESLAAERPIRAARRIQIASGWLDRALKQLDCAAAGLRKTRNRAAQSPELALDAPAKLAEVSVQWMKAAGQLAAFSKRLEDTSTWLFDGVMGGSIAIPIEEQGANAGKRVPIRLIPPPLRPPNWFPFESNDAPCIPARRRSVCLTVVEASRRIFRGRAPPLVSTCSL